MAILSLILVSFLFHSVTLNSILKSPIINTSFSLETPNFVCCDCKSLYSERLSFSPNLRGRRIPFFFLILKCDFECNSLPPIKIHCCFHYHSPSGFLSGPVHTHTFPLLKKTKIKASLLSNLIPSRQDICPLPPTNILKEKHRLVHLLM